MEIFFTTFASALAGFVDSIVGGGGLILLPALFAAYPNAAPATLFGTNKSASVWGTAFATWQYSRRVQVRWSSLLPAAGVTMLAAFAGAWWVTLVSAEFLRRLLPAVLVLVLIYTLMRKDMGRHHAPRFHGRAELLATSTIGLTIGFYDGFFGPGTGSFFVFLLVRWLGYDFLNASVAAKLLNLASNIAALQAAAQAVGMPLQVRVLQEPALQVVERVYLMTTNSAGFYTQLGFETGDSQKLMLRRSAADRTAQEAEPTAVA